MHYAESGSRINTAVVQYQEKNYFRKFDGIHYRALSTLSVEWFIKFPAFAMTGKLNNSTLVLV